MGALSEQEQVRRDKLKSLRALGINPYPADLFPVDHSSAQIKANFTDEKEVVVAGRLMSRRIQGKASFAELQDSQDGFKCISIETKSVQVKIRLHTMRCTKNS